MDVVSKSQEEKEANVSSNSAQETANSTSSDEEPDISEDEDTPMSATVQYGYSDRFTDSAMNFKGDSFCDCHKKGKEKECICGEENSHESVAPPQPKLCLRRYTPLTNFFRTTSYRDKPKLLRDLEGYFEWVWDEASKSAASFIKEDMREVMFHIDYSCGTAAVRGTMPMKSDQYFWEIKMTTPVYGTDMMVGVCTADLDLNKCRHGFCSMLGQGSDSWGLSYTGIIQHKQLKQPYTARFCQGSIIGVHLDMWQGNLSFYLNHRPLGIAYRGLQGKTLFPVVSSTAARSGMKVICNSSFPTSLQFMCCQMLRKCIPQHLDVLKVVSLPPGLRDFLENNIRWLLQPCPPQGPPKDKNRKRTLDHSQSDEGPGPCKRFHGTGTVVMPGD